MKAPEIAVATITLVRDVDEETLLRRALPTLAGRGMPVCVSDGGSGAAFTAFMAGLGGVRLIAPGCPGLVGQVAAAVDAAVSSGSEYVLYTESDKQEFFDAGLAAFLEQASSRLARPALVVAARSAASFETFPPVQRHTERTINDLCGESCGTPGD